MAMGAKVAIATEDSDTGRERDRVSVGVRGFQQAPVQP
jgi:hypothetical protein